jgi:hypothetical protein
VGAWESAAERLSRVGELCLGAFAEGVSLLLSTSFGAFISLDGPPFDCRATSVMCGGSGPVTFLGGPQINTIYCTLRDTGTGNFLAAVGRSKCYKEASSGGELDGRDGVSKARASVNVRGRVAS